MIYIQKIKFKNFLSFGNRFTEVDFTKHKKTIILGKNGAGKSTVIDALSYGLFGRPFRRIKKSGLTNTINKRDLEVHLYFSINKTQYRIVRGMFPNLFEIYIDDVMVPQDASNRDYQKYLEKDILNLNWETFSQIVILGSSNYTPFMKMSKATKREVIEDILNISIFSRMNEILKQKIKDHETDLSLAENKKDILKKQYTFLFEKYQKTMTSKEERILQKKQDLLELEERRSELMSDVENKRKGLREVQSNEELKKAKKKLERFKIQISGKERAISSEIEFYDDNDICSKCKTIMTPEFKEERKVILEDKNREIQEALKELDKRIIKINKELADISADQQWNAKINDGIVVLQNSVTRLNDQIQYLNTDLLEIERETNELISQVELENMRSELKTVDSSIRMMYDKNDIMKKGLTILKDSGAKTRIIRFYLPVINKTINEFLEMFDFNVLFTFDENFEETIKARHIESFTYGNFSEGEKIRIDLSLMFTWREIAKRKNSANINLLFFDEILDSSMDIMGLESFMEIVDSFTPNTNLFVISHREGVESGFDSILQARKQKRFSEYCLLEN